MKRITEKRKIVIDYITAMTAIILWVVISITLWWIVWIGTALWVFVTLDFIREMWRLWATGKGTS